MARLLLVVLTVALVPAGVPRALAQTVQGGPATAEALIRLGDLYASGTGVGRDVGKAEEYYQKAADLGSVTAQLNLGELLARSGRNADETARGLKLLNDAVAAGSVSAQVTLGEIYSRGEGVAMDPALARKNLEAAAKAGSGLAMLRLGDLNRSGRFEAARPKQAISQYRDAMAAGNSYAAAALGRMLIESKAKRATLAEGEALLRKAAKSGIAEAEVALATRYFYGSGVAQNPKQGLKLLQAAAAQGNTVAMEELIAAYRNGKRDGHSTLVRRDPQQARNLLKQFSPLLPPGHAAQGEMLLACRVLSARQQDALYQQFNTMAVSDRKSMMRDLLDECPGFFTFIVQKRFMAMGLLKKNSTKINAAAASYCRRTGTAYFCRAGLYSPQMAELIGYSFN